MAKATAAIERSLAADGRGADQGAKTGAQIGTGINASVPADRRAALGVTDNLVRLSVGVEDIADLTDDVMAALRR